MALKDRVKALRKQRGWTQVELSRRAHLHFQTVFNLEHGKNSGGWKSREKLAAAFGISVAELEGTPKEAPHAPTDSIVAALTASSDKDLLAGLVDIVKELERRGQRTDSPPPPPAPPQPPARPRRRR